MHVGGADAGIAVVSDVDCTTIALASANAICVDEADAVAATGGDTRVGGTDACAVYVVGDAVVVSPATPSYSFVR